MDPSYLLGSVYLRLLFPSTPLNFKDRLPESGNSGRVKIVEKEKSKLPMKRP